MNEKAYSELKRNTIIIAIANLGSKAISFILAPLYSYFMSTGEYGSMDLITTTVGLLLPFICLDIFEASFRFANDETYDNRIVLSSSILVWLIENIIIWGIVAIIHLVVRIPAIAVICIASATLDSLYQILAQFARGQGKMKIFAVSGIINSVALLLLNVVFMIFLVWGLNGWIISFVCAKAIAVLYLFLREHVFRKFSFNYIKKDFLHEAIRFCLPLMPSASMWWIMNASDRYIISFYLGVSMTGIYAAANKLPVILSVFENVFYQSWQTTAINTMNTDDRDQIYSSVFFKYFQILTLGIIAILLILKPMTTFLFADDYHGAWISSAVLVVGVMVHALAGNLGTIYTVFRNTTGALKTSAIGAIVNIVLNFIFIKAFGMNAAAWTTLISYIIVLIIRWNDIKENVNLKIPKDDAVVYLCAMLFSLILYYVESKGLYTIRVLIFIFTAYKSRDVIKNIITEKD